MLKNRIVVAPMGCPKAITPSSTNYGGLSLYDKSLGGSGIVNVNGYEISNMAKTASPFDKYARDATREVLSLARSTGAIASIELSFHAIPLYGSDMKKGLPGPSDGWHFMDCPMYEMDKEELEATKQAVVKEALAARNFGFDMVMLHFGHDSLCSLFLSPVWNVRTDEYGGSLENRCRYPREVLEAVRAAVGKNFPIMVRVSRQLMVPETFSEDDMLYFLKSVEDTIDIANISCGMDCYGGTIDKYTANSYSATPIFIPRMYSLDFCERVKKGTKLIVCIVGGVNDPLKADEAIREGKTDLVMLGRQLIADPYWPNKAKEGKDDDIVPCIRCLNCYHISTEHANVQCSVNPRFRREHRVPLKLEKTEEKKKVVIVGGGPAGMKAALTADQRGHEVILLEKSDRLGGQLKLADYGDYKEDLKKYRDYLIHQVLDKSNVEIRFNITADKEYLEKLKPDYLIIAIGGDFITPRIKGVEYARQATSIYHCFDEVKGDVVIVGGGAIGCETALDLCNLGHKVTIVEMADALAGKSSWLYRHGLYNTIRNMDNPPEALLKTAVREIREDGVLVEADGEEKFIKADTVLLSVGMYPKKEEAFTFYGITPDTALVGDCHHIGQVVDATNDAYFLAANI